LILQAENQEKSKERGIDALKHRGNYPSYVQRRLLFPELGGVRDPRTEAFRRSDEWIVLSVVLEVRYATATNRYRQTVSVTRFERFHTRIIR